ncbi:phage portal protein, partial [Aeromicrobium sp. Leaf272]|uniref:phage portal protein n=1 Tax=Aeromicrobium sp. Leaf272 TaxID=1736317 RepID=UPI0035176DE8
MSDNKQGFIKRLFSPTEYRADDPFVLVPPAYRGTANVSTEAAMGVSTVYRCVDLITNSIAQLELEAYRSGVLIDPAELPLVVREPDKDRSRSDWLKRIATCLVLHGNAYLRVVKASNGQPQAIYVLNPLGVHIEFNDKGQKFYNYGTQKFTEDEVVHIRLGEWPGNILGVGPLQAGRATVSQAIELRDYPSNWHKNNGIPTGILKTDKPLEAGTSQAYKDAWHTSQAEGGIAVLGQGLDFQPIVMNASDIAFIESANLSDLQIARMFGVDAAYLNIPVGGSSLTYTNRQDLEIQFIKTT